MASDAAKLQTGETLGKLLIDALGLPKYTKWLELRVAVDEIVTVKCGYYPRIDAAALAFAEYTVIDRRDIEPAPGFVDVTNVCSTAREWLPRQPDGTMPA
jgi:hypothetical protein